MQVQIHKPLALEPKWLTEDLKHIFKYEIHILNNGFRLTKLVLSKEKH